MTLEDYKRYYGEKRGEQQYEEMLRKSRRLEHLINQDNYYVSFVLGRTRK